MCICGVNFFEKSNGGWIVYASIVGVGAVPIVFPHHLTDLELFVMDWKVAFCRFFQSINFLNLNSSLYPSPSQIFHDTFVRVYFLKIMMSE